MTGDDEESSADESAGGSVETEKRWGVDPSEVADKLGTDVNVDAVRRRAATGEADDAESVGPDGEPVTRRSAATTGDSPAGDAGVESPLLTTYRHDVHKLRGRSHDAADDEFVGVQVNQDVPHGADSDAALLSRPRGEPEQTVANHESPRRLSLVTGSPASSEMSASDIEAAIRGLSSIGNPEAAHAAWLGSEVAALFNESVYYPYTSVKYHVLLAAALVSNYEAGASFEDLFLVVDDPDAAVVPHRTVLATPAVSLRVTHEPGDRPAASLGAAPARSFADVWARVPEHPLDTDGNRRAMILDSQLRRIRSWSAALQFIEDYTAVVDGVGGVVR